MNKSLIALLLVIVGISYTHAQTSAGSMMLGGGVNFTSTSNQSGSANDESGVTFSPSFGYFISDNFAVGAGLSISSEREGTGAGKTTRSSFGFGPFARYYLFTSNEQFAFFGQAQLSFGTGRVDPPFGDVVRNSSLSFALSPGAAFFFNEHWAIEFAIRGFEFSSYDPNKDNDDDKYTTVELGLSSFSPTLGFRYHF